MRKPTMQVALISAFLAAPALLAACTADVAQSPEDLGVSGKDLNGVSLQYEGTCNFLRQCSGPSGQDAPPNVTWGCGGTGPCSDGEAWIAAPNSSYCGQTMKICSGSRCVNALVKDVSVSHGWEGSNGTLDALGLPHGFTGKCSGYGGGTVNITKGSGSGGVCTPKGG